MARRKNTKKNKIQSSAKAGKDMRFKISLVILIALLCSSSLLLLITLIGEKKASSNMAVNRAGLSSNLLNSASAKDTNQTIEDPALDFRLKIPSQMGKWMYKIGYAKSPTDDSLSNQYLKVFVPANKSSESKNFEENYEEVLSIRKFSESEWTKLEKGCEKGNLFYCEMMGEKISQGNGKTYAFSGSEKCRSESQGRCKFSAQIVKSFQLK